MDWITISQYFSTLILKDGMLGDRGSLFKKYKNSYSGAIFRGLCFLIKDG